MIEINWHPSRKELRVFAALLAAFVAIVAAITFHRTDSIPAAIVIAVIGLAVSVIGWLVPGFMRRVYIGWMIVVFPIGWTISHIVIGFVYYLVLTPIGLCMKIVRRDALHMKFDRTAKTYWQPRDENDDPRQYFRQF